jgi:hypothetical protein
VKEFHLGSQSLNLQAYQSTSSAPATPATTTTAAFSFTNNQHINTNNNLEPGARQAFGLVSSFYVLGFHPFNEKHF